MRKATAFATLVFVLFVGLPALAKANLDGNELLLKCEADIRTIGAAETPSWKDMADGAYCMGMVRGVYGVSDDVVPPNEGTLGQLERVVLLFLQTHPEELHKPDYVLVHEALHKAFPAK
jgi:hypothetical protein